MNNGYLTSVPSRGSSEPDPLFRYLEPPFDKSKEEVWTSLAPKLSEKAPVKITSFQVYKQLFAVAAFLVLFIGIFLAFRYYSVTIFVPSGNYATQTLPDGSEAKLNAGSELTYYPLWWRFSRVVHLEGEGFFYVHPGNKLEIRSSNGKTIVLGTKFIIYARADGYHVRCISGSVKVSSTSGNEVVLGADYRASIGTDGNITVTREKFPGAHPAWSSGEFRFTSTPLRSVLDEIERQFDVAVILEVDGGRIYTGSFLKDKSVEEVLGLVCKPFGLIFVKRSAGIYEIL